MTPPPPDDPAYLAALVGSRICHDLVNPLGAVANGLELLALGLQGRGSEELSLVDDSLARALALLRFFRIAFGHAAPGSSLSRREIGAALDGCFRGGRLSVAWEPATEVARTDVRLAFLALLCIETALPLGGQVRIDRAGDGWRLEAEGPRLAAEGLPWQTPDDSRPGAAEPATVAFALLAGVAAARGRPPLLERSAARLTLRV